jgi:tRNA (guanine37-N1)-methyltransferase
VRIDILTLFPGLFPGPLGAGVVGRAAESGVLEIAAHDLRGWAGNRHRQVDDMPYGGGAGMVLKPEPVFAAVRDLKRENPGPCVLLTPQGRLLDQALAHELANKPGLILVAGRYEGFDERIRTDLADAEVSIGDFVLSGGEIAAMVVVEVVARLIPGVLGDEESAGDDSFSAGTLEYPQYTRPAEFEGLRVPDVLLSGDHGKIKVWRDQQALERTTARRPDLIRPGSPNPATTTKDKGEAR